MTAKTEKAIVTEVEQVQEDADYKKSLSSVSRVQKTVEDLVIESGADQAKAADIRVKLKTIWKEIEGRRKYFVNPLNTAKNRIQAEFKPKMDKVETIVRTLDNKLVTYQNKIEAEAEAERVRIEKENQKKLEKHEKKVAEGKASPVPQFAAPEIEVKNKIQTKTGGVHYTTQVGFDVIDRSLIPDKYFILDEVAIRKVIVAGGDIPGVKRTEKKVVSGRTS